MTNSRTRRRPGWRWASSAALVASLCSPSLRAAPEVRPEVVRSFPHDPTAFTQGLLFYRGRLYESTGRYGASTLRRVLLETGEVTQQHQLPDTDFGEGLALVGGKLVQLTWRGGRAYVYDLRDFSDQGRFRYEGEGWGLCFDGETLVMSNGSDELTLRDPQTFRVLSTLRVTADGAPVSRLNELECVRSVIYANVWLTDSIVRIDKKTGEVLHHINAAGLHTVQNQGEDVLNGIAYNEANGHFYLTGKLWPKLFEVRLPFNDASPSSSPKPSPSAAAPAASAALPRAPAASVVPASPPVLSAVAPAASARPRQLANSGAKATAKPRVTSSTPSGGRTSGCAIGGTTQGSLVPWLVLCTAAVLAALRRLLTS